VASSDKIKQVHNSSPFSSYLILRWGTSYPVIGISCLGKPSAVLWLPMRAAYLLEISTSLQGKHHCNYTNHLHIGTCSS